VRLAVLVAGNRSSLMGTGGYLIINVPTTHANNEVRMQIFRHVSVMYARVSLSIIQWTIFVIFDDSRIFFIL